MNSKVMPRHFQYSFLLASFSLSIADPKLVLEILQKGENCGRGLLVRRRRLYDSSVH